MAKILLTHSQHSFTNYYGNKALAQLKTLGEVIRNESTEEPTEQELIAAAQDCDIIVSFRVPPITASVFEQLPKLAAVCRVAVDVRNIDIDAASRHGVLVTQASAGFGASVAEWVVGVMIDLSRHISTTSAAYWAGLPPPTRMGRELRGATLGVIGYGTIGQYLCGLGLAFGMSVKIYDPYTQAREDGVVNISFNELLATADYVVCLAPATAETANLMDEQAFKKMKRSAFFINASRGELVNENDLLQALNDELIAGCALDVGSDADQKPAPRLAGHPRVVASPHIAGLTPQAAEHQAMDTVAQIKTILAGQIPTGALNAPCARRLAKFQI